MTLTPFPNSAKSGPESPYARSVACTSHTASVANLEPYGARLIPIGQFAERMHELNSADPIVVHCRSGARSAKAFRHLHAAGFRRIWNLKGGILAWAEEVDPTLPRY